MKLHDLREQNRMTWIAQGHGWLAAPEEIVTALSKDGFEECKRELTTSRRDLRPAGGVWQGVNPRSGSVASVIWVTRPAGPRAIVFIDIDGESLKGDHGHSKVGRDPYNEEGGEG
jgi:hypothetical protein